MIVRTIFYMSIPPVLADGFSPLDLAQFGRDGYCLCVCPHCRPHFYILVSGGACVGLCGDCQGCQAEFDRRELEREMVHPRPAVGPGYVYFARSKTTGLIKIGRSFDPETRLQALSSQLHDRLKLVRCIAVENCVEGERRYHRMFSEKRLHHEWFSLARRDLAKI